MENQIESWKDLIDRESQKDYYRRLKDFVDKEYKTHTVYPERRNIFRALELCPLYKCKVVILGQDPYHEPGQAHGLAFSVQGDTPAPPSLQNIFAEIGREYKCDPPECGDLTAWAKQGVLLLNTVLTVREHEAFSHASRGWETFTGEVLKTVAEQNRPVVFMLWGKPAQTRAEGFICNSKHLVLKTSHPSPLSAYRGFDGCGHFIQCNNFLITHGVNPINWTGRKPNED